MPASPNWSGVEKKASKTRRQRFWKTEYKFKMKKKTRRQSLINNINQKMQGQLYLGVMEEKGGKGSGDSLWGGALQKQFGGTASSSIGQTICGSGSEG